MSRRLNATQERDAWTKFIETGQAIPSLGGNKFNAVKKEVNGREFDSTLEGARAIELQWSESQGLISDLKYQVPFEIVPKQGGESAVFYVADFTYLDENGTYIVEDVKGHRTAVYRLKRKLMLYVHGILILETGAKKKRGSLRLRYRKPAPR